MAAFSGGFDSAPAPAGGDWRRISPWNSWFYSYLDTPLFRPRYKDNIDIYVYRYTYTDKLIEEYKRRANLMLPSMQR